MDLLPVTEECILLESVTEGVYLVTNLLPKGRDWLKKGVERDGFEIESMIHQTASKSFSLLYQLRLFIPFLIIENSSAHSLIT